MSNLVRLPSPVCVEVTDELREFRRAIRCFCSSSFDLDALVDAVCSSIRNARTTSDDFRTLGLIAADVAYGDRLLSGPIETGTEPTATERHGLVEAVMQLGHFLRNRLLELGLVDPATGTFTHCFNRVYRDRLLKLVPVSTFGVSPNPCIPGR